MLKPSGKNKNISLDQMQVIRNSLFSDLTKVTLGALFDDEVSNQKCLHTSDVIFDKPRYLIEIKGVPVRSICTENDHIIYIDHNSDIKVLIFNLFECITQQILDIRGYKWRIF